MKAVVINKVNSIDVKEVEKPELRGNEVLVKPIRGGICGTDIHIYEGNFIGTYPIIPCHEFSGVIEEVGTEVKSLKPGDKVIVDPNVRCGYCRACKTGKLNVCENYSGIGVTRPGGFAEFTAVPEKNAFKFKNCSHEIAAFGEPLACVLYGQSRLQYSPEQKVIIWGAGAIGLLHLLVCKNIYGCKEITVVDLDSKKLDLAKKLGAENTALVTPELDKSLQAINPNKWDITIDATGSVKALASLFKHLGKGGQALLFSVYDQKEKLSISPFEVFLNDWKICGSLTYNNDFFGAVRALDSGLINPKPLLDEVFELNQTPEVIQKIAHREITGKIQIEVNK